MSSAPRRRCISWKETKARCDKNIECLTAYGSVAAGNLSTRAWALSLPPGELFAIYKVPAKLCRDPKLSPHVTVYAIRRRLKTQKESCSCHLIIASRCE